jgi:hypothetical protein
MSKRLTFVSLFVLIMALMLGGTVLADGHIKDYDDTASDADANIGDGQSFIENGDFDPARWGTSETDLADGWMGYSSDASGWESWYANINMAKIGDTADGYGMNDALGMFVRNVGGDGPHYMYASNHLMLVPAAGTYHVQIHGTYWGDYSYYTRGTVANSMAWYAISDEADPTMVADADWRELVVIGEYGYTEPGNYPCPNSVEKCAQVGRYEMAEVAPGQYLHLRAGMKFNPFNEWTVFEIDDISINSMDPMIEDLDGHQQNNWHHDDDGWDFNTNWLDGDMTWEEEAAR